MRNKIGDFDWNEIQKFHDNGGYLEEICRKFNFSKTMIITAVEKGLFIKRTLPQYKHSGEMKNKLSEKRKLWLKENPDKHPWRNRECFISIPCEFLKEQFKKAGINFYPEFTPIKEHNFSIDIAFPNEKIGIEINGNQHYERDGKLKPYYQERHNLIEAEGWKLHEIPCAMVWNNEFVENLILSLTGKIDPTFDYKKQIEAYEKNKIEKFICPTCKNKKTPGCKECKKCAKIRVSLKLRKVERPEKEELEKLVDELPMTKIGKMFGVSDITISKWCKSYGIILKNRRGYWQKLNI